MITYADVCESKSKEEMVQRFDAMLNELCAREGGTPESYRLNELSNIGYWTGYYSSDTAKRVRDWLGATHPIFGTSHADGTLTSQQAFEAGESLGKSARARQASRSSAARRAALDKNPNRL